MRVRAAAALLGFTVATQLPSAGCSNAQLQGVTATPPEADHKLSVSGQFCTQLPDPSQFPARILFVVDISGSMAVSDP
jgi:hypothetical protein